MPDHTIAHEDEQEHTWQSRTHTVTDPAGTITATTDRDRKIIELGIGDNARGMGERRLQETLLTVLQLAYDKAGVGLRKELAERNPGASTSLLSRFTPSVEEYRTKEQAAFSERN